MAGHKMWSVTLVLLFYSAIVINGKTVVQSSRYHHMVEREEALAYESSVGIGGDIHLSPKEQYVDKVIRDQKVIDFEEARLGKIPFLPSVHFFEAKSQIDNSSIFKIIQQMPKGAVLHIHDSAMVSLDWVVKNITYRDYCYMCQSSNKKERLLFRFADQVPAALPQCQWELVRSRRNSSHNVEQFDNWLRGELSLLRNTDINSLSQDELWASFTSSFSTVEGLVFHAPVFRDYFRQALVEFYEDNVQYVEARIILQETYNIDGTKNDFRWLLGTYKNITDEFIQDYPEASGAKLIITDLRYYNSSVINKTIQEVIKFREEFPDFIVGFDLVGQEDRGQPLLTYLDDLLLPNKTDKSNLPYIFHAGETVWQGVAVDENIIDAILLGTKRIGHGYALPKHPWALEQVREKQIAIEVNPISNQVLGMVKDLRNHPATSLFAQNYPAVISCDDPPMWGAKGLSYDFFQAFMGMTGSKTGLAFLKKLAMNSLEYSSMSSTEKTKAMGIWQLKWDAFIDGIVANATSITTQMVFPPEEPSTRKPSGDSTTVLVHSSLIFGTILLSLFM